jgi:phosphopantothenoylcysteine decarboxylase/phosphopantothenate--cysteine ligase
MGYAIARAALEAGAAVKLISGPTALHAAPNIQRIDVVSARDMFDAVKKHLSGTDIFISVAAVGDYRPVHASEQKIKKRQSRLTVELTANPDILAHVAGMPGAPFCVGFAAESEKLLEHAQDKRRRKRLPLVAANLVQDAIGTDDNELALLDDDGIHHLRRAPKEVLAQQLIAHVAKLYGARKNGAARQARPHKPRAKSAIGTRLH